MDYYQSLQSGTSLKIHNGSTSVIAGWSHSTCVVRSFKLASRGSSNSEGWDLGPRGRRSSSFVTIILWIQKEWHESVVFSIVYKCRLFVVVFFFFFLGGVLECEGGILLTTCVLFQYKLPFRNLVLGHWSQNASIPMGKRWEVVGVKQLQTHPLSTPEQW